MATLGGREVKGGKGRGGKEREERREEIQWGGGGIEQMKLLWAERSKEGE
jgi:hypothetical protein